MCGSCAAKKACPAHRLLPIWGARAGGTCTREPHSGRQSTHLRPINSRPSFSTGTSKRSRSEGTLSGNRAIERRGPPPAQPPSADTAMTCGQPKARKRTASRSRPGVGRASTCTSNCTQVPCARLPAAPRKTSAPCQHPGAGGDCRNSGGSIRCISCSADPAQPLHGLRHHLNRRIDIGLRSRSGRD